MTTRLEDSPAQGIDGDREVTALKQTVQPGQWQDKPAGVQEVHNYSPLGNGTDLGYRAAITMAFVLLVAVAGATMYVSFEAQKTYVAEFKSDDLAVVLEALSWDLAALSFAILGLATALRGRSALTARVGNLACVVVSVLMNLAQADMHDWGSVLVWAGPPLLYAGVSDRIIVEIQQLMVERRNLPAGHTLWSVTALVLGGFWGVFLWLVRMGMAPKETGRKFRRWFLDEIPYAPDRTVAGDRAAEALEKARASDEVRELAEQEAAEKVAAAERRAEQQRAAAQQRAEREVERMRAEFDRMISEHSSAAQEREDQQQHDFTQQLDRLGAQLEQARQDAGSTVQQVREQSAREREDLERRCGEQVEQVRAEAQGARERVEQHLNERLAQAERASQENARTVAELRREREALVAELEVMREAASSKQRMRWLYEQLGRQGDPRYGDRTRVREVAHELIEQAGMSPNSVGTAVGYLNDHLKEKEEAAGGAGSPELVGLS